MLQIVLSKDYTYLRSLGWDLAPHAHPPVQISLAEPGHTIFFGDHPSVAYLIGRNEPHTLITEASLHTFLINPALPINRELSQDGVQKFIPPVELAERLRDLEVVPQNRAKFDGIFFELLQLLGLGDTGDSELDERIIAVINHIDELESKRIAAGVLAEKISLSESRLLHLFKSELHITIRSYLLWSRLYEGAKLVANGSSITDAAHSSGFTDSAHFARVFRKMFGTTLTQGLGSNTELLVI